MEPIRLDEFINFRFLSNLQLSPNAAKAAFVVSKSNEDKDGYVGGIWTVDLQTKECRQLTAGKDERSYLWMDDDTILFASKRDSKKKETDNSYTDFFEISLHGGEAVKKMTVPAPVHAIKQISKGTYLVEAEYDNNLPEDFFTMSREEREKLFASRTKEKDYEVFDELPFWRNGAGVTNKKRGRLYIYRAQSGKMEPLTGPMYQLESFDLSSDGRKLVYCGSEFNEVESLKQELVEVDIASRESNVLIPLGSWNIHQAAYAGDKIVVTATENKNYGINENSNLYLYDRASHSLQLVCAPDRSFHSSVGSDCRYGSGKNLVGQQDGVSYITTDRNSSKINHVDWEGSIVSLTANEGSVDCMDRKGEVVVYVAMRGDRLQEIYCLEDGKEVQLTHLNEKALEGRSVITPKMMRITNNDGVEIDGWVLEPVNFDSTKSYPAILDIHGGPKTVYGTCFFHEMQYWANQGYFVFFCNPRGGDGRGNQFADIRGRYGQEDYEDIMQFTDYVLWSYPQIDKSRVGVTGGSYGGFMTNWIIGHTNRFASAASQRSISNWISMEGTSDIGPYFGLDQAGGDAWNNFEQAWWHSPLKYADKCTTPTLFIHSDEDYRCWMVEAYQMFSALKVHGVESRICLFHGENHELSRSGKPEHRIRRLKEITEWFDHYLKAEH